MSEEEKAKELVDKFRNEYKWVETDYRIDLYRDAKQCALICVDEKIEVLEKLRKPEYTTFIEWDQLKTQEEADTMDGYEYIDFLKGVKSEIEKL